MTPYFVSAAALFVQNSPTAVCSSRCVAILVIAYRYNQGKGERLVRQANDELFTGVFTSVSAGAKESANATLYVKPFIIDEPRARVRGYRRLAAGALGKAERETPRGALKRDRFPLLVTLFQDRLADQ